MEEAQVRDQGGVDALIDFLDSSPSPFHAAASAAETLVAHGFGRVQPDAPELPDRGFMVRGGALLGWNRPPGAPAGSGFRIVGAHTDSPGLRLKPLPDVVTFGWQQLAVEVYGGVLANSWLDRDLGLAGRVVLDGGEERLVAVAEPLCRVPQLAIHLDRDVNDRGLVLDKQLHLTPVWGVAGEVPWNAVGVREWLADRIEADPDAVRAWDIALFDVTPATRLGHDRSLLSSGRLDNQVSCWAAANALAEAPAEAMHTAVIALFDHEEVGSESTTGAAGPLLEHLLERLDLGAGGDRATLLRAFTRSRCISADNAHAVHPNYPERHEPGHRPMVNRGPAVKLNANQRYATSAASAAWVGELFEAAGVPHQTFVSRNSMPCGSTIGPITATRLGIDTVDVGVPQLSMHSARELCGVADPPWLAVALGAFFSG